MLRPCSGLLALLLAFTVQAQKKEGSPEAVAAGLYARVQQLRSEPMQDVTVSSQVADLLGSALSKAVAAQETYQSACAAVALPDTKPHMLDQSVFLDAPDGPESIETGAARITGNTAWVPVTLRYVGGERALYQVLLEQDAQWRILDIRWSGGSSLVRRLREFSAYRCVP